MRVSVLTTARVETWLDVDVTGAEATARIAEIEIPRNRWSYWNHAWRREQRLLPIPDEVLRRVGADPIVRVSVQPGPVWTWRRAPRPVSLGIARD